MEIEYIKDVVRNYVTKIIKSPSMPEYNSLLTDKC